MNRFKPLLRGASSIFLFPFSLRSFLVLSTVITRGNDRRIYWGSVDTVGKAFLGRLPVPSSLNGDRRLLFVLQHRSELSASGAANSHREHAIVARPGPFPVGSRGSLEQHAVQQRKLPPINLNPPFYPVRIISPNHNVSCFSRSFEIFLNLRDSFESFKNLRNFCEMKILLPLFILSDEVTPSSSTRRRLCGTVLLK